MILNNNNNPNNYNKDNSDQWIIILVKIIQ